MREAVERAWAALRGPVSRKAAGWFAQSVPHSEPEAAHPVRRLPASADVLVQGTQLDPYADPRSLVFSEIDGLPAYERYREAMSPIYRKRRYIELALASSQSAFTYRGHNQLLGHDVDFEIDYLYSCETVDGLKLPNYRERVVCAESGLNSRLRGILLVLRHFAGEDVVRKRIYVTEQLTPFYAFLSQRSRGVVGSEYFGPDVARGAKKGGVNHEDITALTFADGAFDIIVTNDVLEHVPDYQSAFGELYRTLAPGGILFITVPFITSRYDHLIRARLGDNNVIEHIEPPEYHGDPVNPEGGVLCFQIFGWKLLEELKAAGFKRASAVCFWSLHHGLLGGEQLAFCAWK